MCSNYLLVPLGISETVTSTDFNTRRAPMRSTMTSTSQPSRLNMPTPLETIPNEIFDQIISYLVPPAEFMFLPCLTMNLMFLP